MGHRRTQTIGEYTIYPYVHSFSNVPRREVMLKAVQIPDTLPSDLPAGSNFSLVAGALHFRTLAFNCVFRDT